MEAKVLMMGVRLIIESIIDSIRDFAAALKAFSTPAKVRVEKEIRIGRVLKTKGYKNVRCTPWSACLEIEVFSDDWLDSKSILITYDTIIKIADILKEYSEQK